MQKTVVIIGGGIGGCATGALLAISGFKVVLIEGDSTLGGRTKSFQFRNYLLDNGAHNLGDVDSASTNLVLEQTKPKLDLVECGNSVLFDPADRKIHDSMDYAKRNLTTEDIAEAERVMNIVRAMPNEEIDKYHDIVAAQWLESVTKKDYALTPWLTPSALGGKENNFISAAIFLHTFKNWLNGKFNDGYPRSGGIGAVTNSLADVIRENGGEVRCNARVTAIGVKDHKVKSVTANIAPFGSSFSQEITIETPIVISTIPLSAIFTILQKEECEKSFIDYVDHWRNVKMQLTMGLVAAAKRSVIKPTWFLAAYQLPRNTVSPDEEITGLFRYMVCPTIVSPSSAPGGYDFVYIERNSYNNQMSKKRDEVYDDLKGMLYEVFPGLKSDSEWIYPYFVSCRTYAHTVGYSRLHDVEVPGIEGMYLCGDQIAGYGEAGKNGITRAFSSALNCADRIRGIRKNPFASK